MMVVIEMYKEAYRGNETDRCQLCRTREVT